MAALLFCFLLCNSQSGITKKQVEDMIAAAKPTSFTDAQLNYLNYHYVLNGNPSQMTQWSYYFVYGTFGVQYSVYDGNRWSSRFDYHPGGD